MSVIGILAAIAGLAVIYVSWSLLKFIFTFFVKIFVFVGMASFTILLFLIFIGSTLTWLADAKQQKELQTTVVPSTVVNNMEQQGAYGIPVPNKKGYVYSPYEGKIVDVRGFPPDSLVKDPYTGKIIIVP